MKTTDSPSTPLYLRALQEASRALTDLDPMGERHDAALIDDALQAHSAALPQLVEALLMAQERITELSRFAGLPDEGQTQDEISAALARYSEGTK